MGITYIPLGDAVRDLVAKASPVLFCDTCALLDLVRLPSREPLPTKVDSCLLAARSILQAVQTGTLSLVAPPLVYDEWSEHAFSVRSETEKHFDKLEEHLNVAQAVARHGGHSIPKINFSSLGLHSILYELAHDLLKSALKLEKDPGPSLKANDRAASYTAPASKGTIKDCILYEHALWVIEKLRKQSFQDAIVFLTSNTKDFCEANGHPKKPIKTELFALKAVLTTTWNWAFHELGAPSTPSDD